MHTTISTLSLAAVAFSTLSAFAVAQEEMPMPEPAVELQKFAPLIGNWVGSGTYKDPAMGESGWKAWGGYKWSHDGFWVQEDFTIEFDGNPEKLSFRAYLGWEAEGQRYVSATVASMGQVALHEVHWLPDGSMMQMMPNHMEGMAFTERSNIKVDGDKMLHRMEMLMFDGPSMTAVDGTFKRVDKDYGTALGNGAFGPKAGEMARINRAAGVYETKGTMTMAPGMPPMNIYGTDTFNAVFGGTVFHGHTDGAAEGMPGKYAADIFWAWDPKRNCYNSVFVSNMARPARWRCASPRTASWSAPARRR